MAKRRKFPYEIQLKDDENPDLWLSWLSEDEWDSTADALDHLKANAEVTGRYRVVQVKADVVLDVEKVQKVTITACGGEE